MLDFRFLIGTILVGIALAMTALRMFGPVEPLIAAVRPDLDTAAVPLSQLAPVIARVPSPPSVPSASRQTPQSKSPPIAAVAIIPKPPASIRSAPVPVPVHTPQIASTPRAPVAGIPARLSPVELAAVPLPSPKPDSPEITGSVEPTETAPAKPKRTPVAVRKPETPEFGELNLFRLFFPQAAGQKPPQGAARPALFPGPFTQ